MYDYAYAYLSRENRSIRETERGKDCETPAVACGVLVKNAGSWLKLRLYISWRGGWWLEDGMGENLGRLLIKMGDYGMGGMG